MDTTCVIPQNDATISLDIVPISQDGRSEKDDPQQAYDNRNSCSDMCVVANLTGTHVATHVFREDIAHTRTTSKPHIAMCAVPGQTHHDVA